MKHRKLFATVAILASSGLFVVGAGAQTPQPLPPASPGPNSQPQAESPIGPRGGWGYGMMGRGAYGSGRAGSGLSEADRTAFFEARLASIKAGLMLTEAQQRLWPAVETAMREMMKQRIDWAERLRKEGQPANHVDRMKRAGEFMTARGGAMTRMAEAMKPLLDSLTEEQKRRMSMLMPASRASAAGYGHAQGRHGAYGAHQHNWGRHHGGWQSHGHGYGPRWRQGMARPDGQRQGEGRRWRQDAPGDGFSGEHFRGDWRRM